MFVRCLLCAQFFGKNVVFVSRLVRAAFCLSSRVTDEEGDPNKLKSNVACVPLCYQSRTRATTATTVLAAAVAGVATCLFSVG